MTPKPLLFSFALLLTRLSFADDATAPTPLVTLTPDKLIAVLQSDATRKAKADACRELAVVGDKSAVPVLVKLLADEQMSHMARYALETMADPGINPALRSQLSSLDGRQLIGVVGTLGVRKDPKAAKPLARLLQDQDSAIVEAAARALGQLAKSGAAKALQGRVENVGPGVKLAFYEGLFRCAEGFVAQGNRKAAVHIYEQVLRGRDLAAQVRIAALHGVLLGYGTHDLAKLKECLRSPDYLVFATAIRAALEMPELQVTKALAEALPSLRPDNQVVVLRALGSRHQVEALPALNAAAHQGAASVRMEATRAIAAIAQPPAVPLLRALIDDPDRAVVQAALDGLAGVPGRDADSAALGLLDAAKPTQQLMGIELVGRRRITAAVPALIKLASDGEAEVRPAALRRVGDLGGPQDGAALLNLLLHSADSATREAGAEALKSICIRAGKPASLTEEIIDATAKAEPARKDAFLSVLSTLGGDQALTAVRTALSDSTPEVHKAAVRALADWPDAAAAPDLVAVVRAPMDNSERVVAFRGFIRMARDHSLPNAERLKMLQEISLLASDSQDKKLVLSALGDINTVESLRLTMTYFTDPLVADEAGAAAVKIADALDTKEKAEVGLVLKQVLKTSNSEPVRAGARKRLEKLGIALD
jgi:HEAT repeat protein